MSMSPAPSRLRGDDVVLAVVRRDVVPLVLVVTDGEDVADGTDVAGAAGVVIAPESPSVLTFIPVTVQ
jgi:hypothetical protein